MAKKRAGAEAARAAKDAKEAKAKSLKEAESAKKAAKEKASIKVRPSSKFPDEETLKKAKGKKGTTKKATVSPQGIRVSPPRAAKRRASSVTSPSGGTSKKLKFTEASTRKSPSKRDPDKNKKRGKGSPKTKALETPETAAGKPPTKTGKKLAGRKDGPEVPKPGEKPTPTTVETQELETEKEGGQKKGPEDPKPGERSTATTDETTRKEGAQEEGADDPQPGKKSTTTSDEPQEPKTGKDEAQEDGAQERGQRPQSQSLVSPM